MEIVGVKPVANSVVEVTGAKKEPGISPEALSLYLSLPPESKRKLICMIDALQAERVKETRP